jgi:hypothetical protein
MDRDGYLDLAAGIRFGENLVYVNQGLDATAQFSMTIGWSSGDSDETLSVAWGDVNGDGYLELAAGNVQNVNKVYLNEGGTLSPRRISIPRVWPGEMWMATGTWTWPPVIQSREVAVWSPQPRCI